MPSADLNNTSSDDVDKTTNLTENELPAEFSTVRELTQTDRLNKRLLESFLNRINQFGPPIPATNGSGNSSGSFENNDNDFS